MKPFGEVFVHNIKQMGDRISNPSGVATKFEAGRFEIYFLIFPIWHLRVKFRFSACRRLFKSELRRNKSGKTILGVIF
jgi:hypothetical protein